MRNFLFGILLLSSTIVFSQDSSSAKPGEKSTIVTSINDSLDKLRQDQLLQESMKRNEKNLVSFFKEQKERESSQKKRSLIRIGIGVAMLILLIFGLRRKAKK